MCVKSTSVCQYLSKTIIHDFWYNDVELKFMDENNVESWWNTIFYDEN